ncbi:MAG: iron ABC transporter permease [Spirochaetales bacterium]|nr:iron ABC transporter permease [Spirochaetales bacterium]
MVARIKKKSDTFGNLIEDPALLLSVVVIWAFLGLFVIWPLAKILFMAFSDAGRLSLTGVGAILSKKYTWVAARNSILLGALVGFCGTALGFFFAFTAVRANLSKGWSRLLDWVIILPLISPPFTMAITIIFSFGPRGLITHDLLGMDHFRVYGMWSTLFAETITYFPIAYITLKGILAGIDPTVEDMAFSLGSSRWQVFRKVTLPLSTPGLANSFLLLFAASLADFATPLILAGNRFPVLPTEAFLQITGLFDLKGGAVLSSVLLVPSFTVFLLQRYWVARRNYVTITGKSGSQTKFKSVGNITKYFFLLICVLTALFILYFYVLLLYASLVDAFGAGNQRITLNNYRMILTSGRMAIADTLLIAYVGMLLGCLFGVVVGYITAKKKYFSRKLMEFVAMINYALPGTIVGIAFLITFNNRPLVLTGTALIIILCNVSKYGAYGIRSTVAILQQIHPSIEEASQSLGATSTLTFRRITIPLILPGLFSGLGVVFIRSMTAISATIFLVSLNWTLITVRILENMTELHLGVAAAFSVFVVVVVFVVTTGISFFLKMLRQPGGMRVTSLFGS